MKKSASGKLASSNRACQSPDHGCILDFDNHKLTFRTDRTPCTGASLVGKAVWRLTEQPKIAISGGPLGTWFGSVRTSLDWFRRDKVDLALVWFEVEPLNLLPVRRQRSTMIFCAAFSQASSLICCEKHFLSPIRLQSSTEALFDIQSLADGDGSAASVTPEKDPLGHHASFCAPQTSHLP